MSHQQFKAILQCLKLLKKRIKGRINTNLGMDYIVRLYLKVSLLIKVFLHRLVLIRGIALYFDLRL